VPILLNENENGCAPGLTLLEGLQATRKWAIAVLPEKVFK